MQLMPCGWSLTICFLVGTAAASGQSAVSSVAEVEPDPGSKWVAAASPQRKALDSPRQVLRDQIGMWSSPFKSDLSDATWLVPLGGFTAGLLATDRDVSSHLSSNSQTLLRYRRISDYGLYFMAGGSSALYVLGFATHHEHQRETGMLSDESAIDSLIAAEALRYATGRRRPSLNTGSGWFWHGGTSFPSEHSGIAWAFAGTIAHEYPGPFVKFISYGAATAVSASRIMAKQHFPSDALVGMAIGYLTSEYLYRQHHNQDLPGEAWETPAVRPDRPSHWQTRNMGSPYVPLDSWIYPAVDRLAALGFISTGFADMRPWTRMEAARQVAEAADRTIADSATGDRAIEDGENEAAGLVESLRREFSSEISLLDGGENAEFRFQSLYSRFAETAGWPLTDGDHFGQTVVNDFGRPEQQGLNSVSGISGWAADGPFTVYASGEYQHSPAAPALPAAATQAIGYADFGHSTLYLNYPSPPDNPTPAFSQGRFLDAYVAMNLSDWQISYGNQSLWWGPSQSGPLMFSDNAAPLRMFRVNRVNSFTLPDLLSLLGPIRLEAFIGQFSGYEFVLSPAGLVGHYGQSLQNQPIIHGERMSFKPTSNLEIGLSRTTDYAGPGYPLTIHTFLRSLFSTGNTEPGLARKPGSRRSGFDFSYRIPGIRSGITLYAEGLAEHDEISPILGPDVAAWLGGLYFPRVPRFSKLDFRLEAGYTDPPSGGGDVAHGAFYWDATWITGFQNAQHLMGSWMGRQGQGAQAWASYWCTPRNRLQFGFRHQKVSRELIGGGGTLTDASVRAEFWPRTSFSLSALLQYERWDYPVLASTAQANVTSSIQLSFWPRSVRRQSTGIQ
jgi:membrane-associated phospholipid phosphatase